MLTGHHFALNDTHLDILFFVLPVTFIFGVLGGFFFGLTHALRHGASQAASKSIWTFDDEN